MVATAPSLPEVVVLDVNETLSDLAPLRDAFEGVGLAAAEVEPWFAGVLRDAFALTLLGENPDFAEIAAASLRVRLDATGVAAAPEAADEVMGRFVALRPHADVVPGLLGLAEAGCRIVTLSNGSAGVARALLEDTDAGPVIDQYLSVADAGVWKPAPSAYAHALERTGVPAGRAMLVAVHPWDIAGARHAGLRTAWLARSNAGYPDHFARAEVEATSLVELAEVLSG